MGQPPDDEPTIPRDPGSQTPPADDEPTALRTRIPPSSRLQALPFGARYQTRRALGTGGMGLVTLCHDQQIGRDVALKEIRPDLRDDPRMEERFVHEARVQAQLEHPAVVPVYELGPTPQGSAFFTMKRVRGVTLTEVLQRLRISGSDAAAHYTRRKLLSDFSRLCQAIDYAHQRGVVHRDIKPANIMLGEYGEVYVLDWGIAMRVPPGARGSDHLSPDPAAAPAAEPAMDPAADPATEPAAEPTGAPARQRAARAMGTPGYAAPEQILDPDAVDARADVYGLGCVLFELLTLRPLHTAHTGLDLLEATLDRDPPAPSEHAPGQEVPPELDVVCLRATARQPGQRYADARALHEAVERFLDGERDLQLRRSLAAEHAEHAQAAAQQVGAAATPGPDVVEARREALQQIGRALALDPTNRSAMQTMIRLLTRPPAVVPPEVERRIAHGTHERLRAAGRLAAPLYMALLLYLPLIWWAGIVDGTVVVAVFGLSVVAGLVSLYTSVSESRHEDLVLVAMLVSMAAMSATAALYGPLVLTPGAIAVNCTAYALTVGPRARRITMITGVLAVVVPLGLEVTGLVPPSIALDAGRMILLPRALDLGGPAAVVLLMIASLGTIVTGTYAVGRVRDQLDHAEQRLEIYSWHFQQLLPEHAEHSLSHDR